MTLQFTQTRLHQGKTSERHPQHMNVTTMRCSRRNWLLSVSGLVLPGFVQGAEIERGPRCPLGFGTYGLPGFTLEQAIHLIAEIGFDSIEIAAMPGYHGAPDQLSNASRKQILKLLADSSLNLGALMGLPRPNATSNAGENREWVKRMLELAIDLAPDSPPIIQSVLGGHEGEWETTRGLFRDRLGSWIELSSDAGVKLAIKPHRGQAMSLPEHAVWLIDQLNAAGKLGLVYDYSHYAYRNLSIAETIATSLPHTSYIVMKDALLVDEKVQFKLPGETGINPHSRILKRFIEGGYRGEVCCEVSSQVWRAKGYSPHTAAKTCHSNLVKIVANSGI